MKKFSVPCNFNGVKAPVTLYIGNPEAKHHPVSFQADWLSKERGGSIPQEVMDSLAKLMDIASKNNVLLEDLCEYALHAATIPANSVLDSGVKKEEEQSAGIAIGSGGGDSKGIAVATAKIAVPAEEVLVEQDAEEVEVEPVEALEEKPESEQQ